MGTEAAWVPLVMSLVAAGASAYNTHQTAKKADNQLAMGIMERGKRQREADAKVNDLVTQQAASSPREERREALTQYLGQLRKNQGAATGALQPITGASEAYREDAAKAALGVGEFGKNFADLMARTDAPVRQRQNEANERAQFGTDIGQIKRFSEGADFLNQLKLQAIRRNAWIDAAAAAAQGYAGAYGSGGGSDAGNLYDLMNANAWGTI